MIERGDVVMVNLDPVLGSEVGRTRPAIVLQNELANRSSPTVTVVPVTSRPGRVYPFQVRLSAGDGGLDRDSKALCEQIRTVARERIAERLGRIPESRLEQLRSALDRHLWF